MDKDLTMNKKLGRTGLGRSLVQAWISNCSYLLCQFLPLAKVAKASNYTSQYVDNLMDTCGRPNCPVMLSCNVGKTISWPGVHFGGSAMVNALFVHLHKITKPLTEISCQGYQTFFFVLEHQKKHIKTKLLNHQGATSVKRL